VNTLGQRIAALIAAQGPISIAEFMTMALHDPQAGYYATRDPFGSAGDFITAPEISQVFGEFLGLWCVQVWHDQGRPARKRLVELGPGRGTLMNDALRAMKVAPEFLDGLEVVLIEASPTLSAIQKALLQECGVEIRWAERLDSSLDDRPLFLLANEFFDALPIRQYVKTPRGWCERMLTLDAGGALAFVLSPTPVPGSVVPSDRDRAPDGGVYEISSASLSLTGEIARAIAHRGGGALIVDYGYDNAGFGETLQAVADHSFAGILSDPGESDLSAHVDFPALAAAAMRNGATAFGPVTQADFLEDLGAVQRIEQLAARHPEAAENLRSRLDRLVGADQMGTLFKALAIVPKTAPKPPGF
jgi:NADH dehydrogenase [ubiquinone] 1 alpha subcomplex assembly factor 7